MRTGYRDGLTRVSRRQDLVNLLLPRVDGQLGIALVISVALHAVLVGSMALTQDPPAPQVISAINVRLSSTVTSSPQAATTKPEEPPIIREAIIDPIPEHPGSQPVVLEALHTSTPAEVTPTDTQQVLKIDAASLQAFIGSTTNFAPPSLNSEIDIAEQYRRQWHQRVQRIGQLNYPEAATKMKLSGQLTLKVAIKTDGSLGSVGVSQSSGHDELDLAALEIVRQASPYEPLPPNLPRSNGQFRFESTWEFRR